MKEAEKAKKIEFLYLIAMLGIIILLFGGAMIVIAVKSGGLANMIDNFYITDNINKRIICSNENSNMIFRSPLEAKYFKEIFNESKCYLEDRDGS